MVHCFFGKDPPRDTFAFRFSSSPSIKLSFDRRASTPVRLARSFKRRRALSDVDGAGNEGRKKRRLRSDLITSRLSRPFSQPATNIVSRGMSKIPVWGAMGKALGRNMMRKAAIMNRIRRRIDAARDSMRIEQEKTGEKLSLRREIVLPKPRYTDRPHPPSPLGLSNYDALDLEDEFLDDESGSMIYSDFNIMEPTIARDEDEALGDCLATIDDIHSADLPDEPPSPPEESITEMLKEDQQGEGLFVQIRD